MIAERHKWLLRDVETCYDEAPNGYPCRVCRVQEKGEVYVLRHELFRHLAAHRKEKVAPREPVADYLEALE